MTKLKLLHRIFIAAKIVLGVALGLQERGRIRVKELGPIKDVLDSIEDATTANLPPPDGA